MWIPRRTVKQFLRSWPFKAKMLGIVCGMYWRFDERLLMVFGYGRVALQAIRQYDLARLCFTWSCSFGISKYKQLLIWNCVWTFTVCRGFIWRAYKLFDTKLITIGKDRWIQPVETVFRYAVWMRSELNWNSRSRNVFPSSVTTIADFSSRAV